MTLTKLLPLLILTVFFFSETEAAKKNLSSGMEDLIQGPLLNSNGKEVSKDVLAGKNHWHLLLSTLVPTLQRFHS